MCAWSAWQLPKRSGQDSTRHSFDQLEKSLSYENLIYPSFENSDPPLGYNTFLSQSVIVALAIQVLPSLLGRLLANPAGGCVNTAEAARDLAADSYPMRIHHSPTNSHMNKLSRIKDETTTCASAETYRVIHASANRRGSTSKNTFYEIPSVFAFANELWSVIQT